LPEINNRCGKFYFFYQCSFTGTEVGIYDRRGIPVFKDIISKKSFEWDGKYNSLPLPTGSYWYIIRVSDGRLYNGWILIKNRE